MLPILSPTWQAPGRPVSAGRHVTTLTRRIFSHRPPFIQARHEELAAFMAGAHAKFTGDPWRRGGDPAGAPPLSEEQGEPELAA
jgi:hypothetical protein